MFLVIVLFLFLEIATIICSVNNNTISLLKIDLSQCKLSHLGLDYLGDVAQSESDARCQSWRSNNPVHKVDKSFTDDIFPERSMTDASNYCRNPNYDPDGPWCYTMRSDLLNETCNIPICINKDCKLTGPGIDYSGMRKKGRSGKKCLSWDKHRKKVVSGREMYEQTKFSRRKFPDETRGSAENYCRNPDGDLGGPWCFINTEENSVEKDYCDVSLCDDLTCMVFTKETAKFTHYTKFNSSLRNLTFSVKLWDPDNFFDAHARLVLTLLALPSTGDEIDDMKFGIEIFISNTFSALKLGNKHTVDYEESINVLTASKFTTFSINWDRGIISLNIEGRIKEIFLAEYSTKGLFSVDKDAFFYYSLQGTNILWATPLCDEEDECELQLTYSDYFERFWPMRRTQSGYDLVFYIRAFHSALVIFQPSPLVYYPQLKIILSPKNNISKITLVEYKDDAEETLKEIEILKLLNFWTWNTYTVQLFGNTVQVFIKRNTMQQMLFEIENKAISSLRWFSPGSDDTLAYWTFYCVPQENPLKPFPPECALNVDEFGYKGTQWFTSEGHPCLPWTVNFVPVSFDAVKNWNYCRDPDGEQKGVN